MGDVVDLKQKDGALGEGAVIAPDQILERAAGRFDVVVVLGLNKGGEVDIRSSHGAQETLYWLERAKLSLLTGRDLFREVIDHG